MIVADDLPPVRHFDRRIQDARGSTFALHLQPAFVQAQKQQPRPSCEQRLVEVVRETAAYKRELRFFRTAYHAMETAREAVASVAQQLTLNYYIRPDLAGHGDSDWLRLGNELDVVLRGYVDAVNAAAQEWCVLESRQADRDTADRF